MTVATVGGVGSLPFAPGTFGSLAALPLLPALAVVREASMASYVVVVVALVGIAVWAAGLAEEALGGHDHSRIVIDEVVGMVVAGVFVPGTWLAAGVVFVLFRLFDSVKPFPAGLIDGRVEGGIGVVGDDVVAGVYAGLLGAVLLRLA